MRIHVVPLALIAVAAMAPLANSQQPPRRVPVPQPIPLGPPVQWPALPVLGQPAQFPNISRMPGLVDLVLAKVDMGDDGPQVIMMIESYRSRTTSVTVTRLVNETRERTIEVDGEKKMEQYTVKVPVTEEREVETKAPAGRKPFKIAGDEIRFFNLDAEEISIDEAGKALTSLRPIFLIDQNDSDPLPLPGICKRVINEDCLVAVTKQKVRQHAGLYYQAPVFAPVAPAVQIQPAKP